MADNKRFRQHLVRVFLSDEEYEYFLHNVSLTGLTKSAYLRQIIENRLPRTIADRELDKDILSQLYAIGNNLNQIARAANAKGTINADRYTTAVKEFNQVMHAFLQR